MSRANALAEHLHVAPEYVEEHRDETHLTVFDSEFQVLTEDEAETACFDTSDAEWLTSGYLVFRLN